MCPPMGTAQSSMSISMAQSSSSIIHFIICLKARFWIWTLRHNSSLRGLFWFSAMFWFMYSLMYTGEKYMSNLFLHLCMSGRVVCCEILQVRLISSLNSRRWFRHSAWEGVGCFHYCILLRRSHLGLSCFRHQHWSSQKRAQRRLTKLRRDHSSASP